MWIALVTELRKVLERIAVASERTAAATEKLLEQAHRPVQAQIATCAYCGAPGHRVCVNCGGGRSSG